MPNNYVAAAAAAFVKTENPVVPILCRVLEWVIIVYFNYVYNYKQLTNRVPGYKTTNSVPGNKLL